MVSEEYIRDVAIAVHSVNPNAILGCRWDCEWYVLYWLDMNTLGIDVLVKFQHKKRLDVTTRCCIRSIIGKFYQIKSVLIMIRRFSLSLHDWLHVMDSYVSIDVDGGGSISNSNSNSIHYHTTTPPTDTIPTISNMLQEKYTTMD